MQAAVASSGYRPTLADVLARIPGGWTADIERIGVQAAKTVRSGGALYFCGNGGSASESQHTYQYINP